MKMELARRAMLGSTRLKAAYLGATRQAHERTNLCTNPNAELNVSGWTLENGSLLTRDTVDPISGTASFKFTNGGDRYITFLAVAGETITFSLDYTTVGVMLDAPRLLVQASGAALSWTYLPLNQVAPARFSVTATAITSGGVAIAVFGSSRLTDVFHFDNVLIEKTATAEPYFDGTAPVWAGTPNNSVSGWRTKRTNLCVNPNFETDLYGWQADGQTITRDTTAPISGVASLKVTPVGSGGDATYNIGNNVVAGETVVFSVNYKTVGTLTGAPNLALVLGGSLTRFYLPLTQEVPERFAVVATATTSGQLQYALVGGTVPTDTMFFDNVLVEKSATLNPYFDGSTFGSGWTGAANASSSVQWSRTNLCTNPNAELNVNNWYSQGTAILTRDTVNPISGTASFNLTGGDMAYVYLTSAYNAGDTITCSIDFRTVGTTGVPSRLYLSLAGIPAISLDLPMTQTVPGRYSVTGTALGSGALVFAVMVVPAGGSTTDTVHFDNVLIEKSPSVGTYFDGSTPTPEWSGTPNASTSTWWVAG